MKRVFLFTYFLLLSFVASFAQHKVIITLSDGTTIEKDVWEVKSISFAPTDPVQVTLPGEDAAVDLGLSIMWANANIEIDGESALIGWGDITGKVKSTDMAYFPQLEYYKDIVNGKYDMARALWGEGWRLPSVKEVRELVELCDWTALYDADNVFIGYEVTGSTGKSIFMPVTGKRCGNSSADDILAGYYWTGIISPDPELAVYMKFTAPAPTGGDESGEETSSLSDKDAISLDNAKRYMGFAVRPVFGPYKLGVSVNVNVPFNIQPKTANITAVFEGDVQDIEEFGLRYSTSYNDVANGGNVTTIRCAGSELPEVGTYTFELKDLEYGRTYYYQAYANVANADSVSDIKHFVSCAKYSVEWVDLGLPSGLRWASYNLSANNGYEVGNLFAWADPEEVSYNQATYPWLVESSPADIAFTEFDVVNKVLGDSAHLPNTYDFLELKKECEWIYNSGEDGTPVGWYVIGPNGKRILLPMAGNRQGDGTIYRNGVIGYYWTSENHSGLNAKCYTFSTSAGISGKVSDAEKYLGMCIRPVNGTSNTFDPYNPPKVENPSDYDKYAVDLGLSVDWSSINVGATGSEQQGGLYAWGELSTKETYSRENYSLCVDGVYIVPIDKDGNSTYDIAANKKYDVAAYAWGGDWQMPDEVQWNELMSECDWTWVTQSGMPGYKVTSRVNGNSIFLAAPTNGEGSYWTSIMYFLDGPFKNNSAYHLEFSQSMVPDHCTYFYRYYGRMVRPVKIKR